MLSAKRIRKLTSQDLGFRLTANAFAWLQDESKFRLERGCPAERINDWILQVLERAGKLQLKTVNQSEIESLCAVESMKEAKNSDEEDILSEERGEAEGEATNLDEDESDEATISDERSLESSVEETENKVTRQRASSNNSNSDENDILHSQTDEISCLNQQNRGIDVVQLPSQFKSSEDVEVEEMREEIERLKRIIQIILNKQAELV
jgi:hypothetical protein